MSERAGDSLDEQIDAALRASVEADERPVDLRGRVLAAIEAGRPAPRAAGRARRAARVDLRVLPGPALALALAALLAVVVVMLEMWPARRHDQAPLASNRGHTTRPNTLPSQAGAPTSSPSRTGDPSAHGSSPGFGRHADASRAQTSNTRRQTARAESWDQALPLLDPPEPIELQPIEEPPMRVAQLEVERLSIDPLEVDPLDGSEEE